MDPRKLNKRVLSFTPRPLYSLVKSPFYPLGRRLGGLRADLDAMENNLFLSLSLPIIEPCYLGCPARSLVTILSYLDSQKH
jgi:hypothetical protein